MNPKTVAEVPPLTSTTLGGAPYIRFPDVTAAIALALSLPKEQWVEWAARTDDSRLLSEALVYLVKSVASTDKNLFGKLVWQLHLRIEQVARRWARGFRRETTEELIEAVQEKVIDIIITRPASRQSDFLEVAFPLAVKRHTFKAVEKRRNAPLSLTAQQHAALNGNEEDAERPTERVEDKSPHVDELVLMLQDKQRRGPLLRRARAAVKDARHYEAILLHLGFGWPISSTDPDKRSLEDFFGMSERQIRNWIRDGLEAIRTALENTHDE